MNIIVQISVCSLLTTSGYIQLNNMRSQNNAVIEIKPHMKDEQTFSSTRFKNFVAEYFIRF